MSDSQFYDYSSSLSSVTRTKRDMRENERSFPRLGYYVLTSLQVRKDKGAQAKVSTERGKSVDDNQYSDN